MPAGQIHPVSSQPLQSCLKDCIVQLNEIIRFTEIIMHIEYEMIMELHLQLKT